MTDGREGTAAPAAGAGELTSSAFWDGYWGGFSLPDAIDERRPFDRTLAAALRELLQRTRGDALEIGCAPGRWLAFLSRQCGLRVSGIEYTADGAAATRRNLELLAVPDADVREADFFALAPEPVFDLVISLGFIEHFTDVEAVVARHAAWVRPGGLLVIGVPNFAGWHGWFQRMLDPRVLALHNLTIMRAERLAELGERAGLVPESTRYLGSFEPALPMAQGGVHGWREFVAKVLLRVARVVRHGPLGARLDGWNGPRVSAYILASYRKPA